MADDQAISCEVCIERLLMDLESDLRLVHEKVMQYCKAAGKSEPGRKVVAGVEQAFGYVRRILSENMAAAQERQQASTEPWKVRQHSGKCMPKKPDERR